MKICIIILIYVSVQGIDCDTPTSAAPTASIGNQVNGFNLNRVLGVIRNIIPGLPSSVGNSTSLNPLQNAKFRDATTGIGNILAQLTSGQNINPGQILLSLTNSGVLSPSGLASIMKLIQGVDLKGIIDNAQCFQDLGAMAGGVSNITSPSNMWILEMLDASGKPGASILKGNFRYMGNYVQCANVRHTTVGTNIQGNTCRASIQLDLGPLMPAMPAGYSPPIHWDVCLPKSCHGPELTEVLHGLNVTNVNIECTKEFDILEDSAAIVAVVILCLFGALVIVGTVVDIYVEASRDSGPNVVLRNGHVTSSYEMKPIDLNGVSSPRGLERKSSVRVNPLSETTMADLSNSIRLPGMTRDTLMPTNNDFQDFRNRLSYRAKLNGTLPEENGKQNTVKSGIKHVYLWQKLLIAFSFPKNCGRIFSVQAGPGNIACLHGIRVLSLAWVILGHTIMIFGTSGFSTIADYMEMHTTLSAQMIINAPLAVDTFYFLSGFLTSYLFIKQCWDKGVQAKTMVLYYFHRYWRLTPPMMIWIMIITVLYKYIGQGRPNLTIAGDATGCKDHWWANMLYISSAKIEWNSCFGVGWFLSNDMMYYCIAPLVLIPIIYRVNVIGFVFASLFIVIHLITNIWLIEKYNFDLFRDNAEYSSMLYFKPYTRVAPFAIGLIFGWIFHRSKGKIRMNKGLVTLCWMVAIGFMLTVTLVTYDENRPEKIKDGWPMWGKLAHETLSRPLWAVFIGWVVLACSSGYGGFINSLLSWSGWLPLSRLSYGAYLSHITIIMWETVNGQYNTIFTYDLLIYQFLAIYTVAQAVAFLLAVFVEMPLIGIERALLK